MTGGEAGRGTAPGITIGRAAPRDLADVQALLRDAALPLDGLDPFLPAAVVARAADGRLIGCAALEALGPIALLRSVAVAGARRGGGWGGALVEEALRLAAGLGVREVYLLTTTAAPFFTGRGFAVIERARVPAAIRGTVEFSSACPASATVMRREVPGARPTDA